MLSHPEGVAGPHPFFGENLSCFKRHLNLDIFSFVSSSLNGWKNNYHFCSGMLGNPEGRDRATPIFWAKIKVGYFFKILQASRSL